MLHCYWSATNSKLLLQVSQAYRDSLSFISTSLFIWLVLFMGCSEIRDGILWSHSHFCFISIFVPLFELLEVKDFLICFSAYHIACPLLFSYFSLFPPYYYCVFFSGSTFLSLNGGSDCLVLSWRTHLLSHPVLTAQGCLVLGLHFCPQALHSVNTFNDCQRLDHWYSISRPTHPRISHISLCWY